jgi:hypothetical protein
MKKPAQHLIAEVPCRHAKVEMTIGIDLGHIWSHYCTLNQDGDVVGRGRFRTTPKAIEKWFTGLPPARIAMEAGTHSTGSAGNCRSWDTKSSWPTCGSCGRSRIVTGRAIGVACPLRAPGSADPAAHLAPHSLRPYPAGPPWRNPSSMRRH